jgi:DNA polymerase III alpha subunit (gram-positive type)
MRKLIFVDTETTGLDANNDRLVELTWAPEEGDPRTLWFGVKEVPEFIDNLIGFTARGLAGRVSDQFEVSDFLAASSDSIMVAANPGFDENFITMAGLWRFHYRKVDIETYAMAKLGLYYVPSMKEIYDYLTTEGYDITAPDHTSRNDVLAMRDSYRVLSGF